MHRRRHRNRRGVTEVTHALTSRDASAAADRFGVPAVARHPSLRALLLLAAPGCAPAGDRENAQLVPLSAELVEAIRNGSSTSAIPEPGTSVPLVGDVAIPLVEVRVNGHGPYRMLVDLGSNVTLLRRDVVDAAEVEVLVERPSSDIAKVAALRIGEALFTDVHVASYDALDVQGVLGFNLLDDTPFCLDYPARRLTLSRVGITDPSATGVHAYELIGRMPFLRASIGGQGLYVNLDTGASEWMTLPLAWKDRFTWREAPTEGPLTTNNQTGTTRVLEGVLLEPMWLGTLRFDAGRVYLNSDAEEAWVGSACLKQFALTFDPARRLVRID